MSYTGADLLGGVAPWAAGRGRLPAAPPSLGLRRRVGLRDRFGGAATARADGSLALLSVAYVVRIVNIVGPTAATPHPSLSSW
jgi:hypothetical protein